MGDSVQSFQNCVMDSAATQTTLQIKGGGSKCWYGGSANGAVLDTRSHSGILSYESTELVIRARCGTPLVEVEALLAEQNQMFAFEPPHFGDGATVGGMIAAGLSGPRRPYAGGMRDFVLGISLLNGKGQVLEFGGQVMKNVAGYDVSRLLTGSLGTLGLILDVSLKVLPRPFAETTLVFAFSEADAIRKMNEWAGQAFPISGSSWHVGRLMLRLSGAEAAVRSAKAKLGGEEIHDAAAIWAALREQKHDFFQQNATRELWRLSLPSVAPPLNLTGKSLTEWGGAQRWLFSEEPPERIRQTVLNAGGHATLFRGGNKLDDVFAPLSAPILKIHRNLKNAFDPHGIFNPGRMYKDF